MTPAIQLDLSDIGRLGGRFASAKGKLPTALYRGLNKTGDKARTGMRRALVAQTGLKYGVFVRALKTKRAGAADLAYVIRSKGGNVSLKYFSPKETRAGVSAAPWGARRVFPGTFMKGGLFPKRKPLKLGGHVYKRAGAQRLKIVKQTSGLYIPEEMITGASASTMIGTAQAELPAEVGKALWAILSGAAPSGTR